MNKANEAAEAAAEKLALAGDECSEDMLTEALGAPWFEASEIWHFCGPYPDVSVSDENGNNIEARSGVAYGAMLGGLSIALSGTTVGHALVHPTDALVGSPHGLRRFHLRAPSAVCCFSFVLYYI